MSGVGPYLGTEARPPKWSALNLTTRPRGWPPKIHFLRKLSEEQENTDNQIKEIRKMIDKQNEINRELQITNKNHIEFPELKNTMNEVKNAIENSNA